MSTRSKRTAPVAEAAAAAPKKIKTEETAAEETAAEETAVEEKVADVDHSVTTMAKRNIAIASAVNIDLTQKHPQDPNFFNDYVFALLAHKADNNNFHVVREDNPNLHSWMQHLKREYKHHLSGDVASTLTDVQVKVLEFLHVPLTSRGDDHWNRFFQLLQAYADRHGHVLVPRLCEIPGLGDWVTDQRRQVGFLWQ
jgi:hypothetical protein